MRLHAVKKRADFAPGIKDKSVYGIPEKELTPGELATYVLQKHETKRRPGYPHYDLRIGTPETGLFSWAVPGAKLPEPGERKVVPQTQVHTYRYGDFEGSIEQGYGAGVVSIADKGKVLITKTTPNSIHFTIAHTKIPTRYVLIKLPVTRKNRNWLLFHTLDPKKVTGVGDKPKISPITAVDLDEALSNAFKVQEKIDGAHGIVNIDSDGKLRVFSVQPRVTGEPIEHTERLGLNTLPQIPELKDTVLRGEIYAKKPSGEALSFKDVSRLLNMSIAKSLDEQRRKNIKAQVAVFAILKHKKIDPSSLSDTDREALLSEIVERLPKEYFHLPETAYTKKDMYKLLDKIQKGKNIRTKEGIIIYMPGGKQLKYKLRPEITAYVTGIYPGKGSRAGKAGGLTFSLTPGGETIGHVGTGFSEKEIENITKNIDQYIGKPVRLSYQEQFPSGKLRAPSFLGWEVDTTKQSSNNTEKGFIKKSAIHIINNILNKCAKDRIKKYKIIVISPDLKVKAVATVEIADTPELRRIGLSYRKSIPDNYGMLFNQVGEYWMKNVNFGLDIAFLNKNGTILEIQHMKKLDGNSELIPIYKSKHKEVTFALEMPENWFNKNNIKIGDIVRLKKK